MKTTTRLHVLYHQPSALTFLSRDWSVGPRDPLWMGPHLRPGACLFRMGRQGQGQQRPICAVVVVFFFRLYLFIYFIVRCFDASLFSFLGLYLHALLAKNRLRATAVFSQPTHRRTVSGPEVGAGSALTPAD